MTYTDAPANSSTTIPMNARTFPLACRADACSTQNSSGSAASLAQLTSRPHAMSSRTKKPGNSAAPAPAAPRPGSPAWTA